MQITPLQWRIAGGVGAVVVLAIAGFFLFGPEGDDATEPSSVAAIDERPPPTDPPPALPPQPDEELLLPPLDESDSLIRELATALARHPGWLAWLATDNLIRTFVVVVDNVAEGTNPAQHVPFMRTEQRFEVEEADGQLRIADASFRRYDGLTAIVDALDVSGSARLYAQLLPLMDEAYTELGAPPDVTFHGTFQRAVARLLETPVIEGRTAVAERDPFFVYTDPALENLSPATKQLMGVGPENLRTIQAKVRDIAEAIGLTDLPPGSVLLR